MRRRRIEALILSLILATSGCMPMNAYAAETAVEEATEAEAVQEEEAQEPQSEEAEDTDTAVTAEEAVQEQEQEQVESDEAVTEEETVDESAGEEEQPEAAEESEEAEEQPVDGEEPTEDAAEPEEVEQEAISEETETEEGAESQSAEDAAAAQADQDAQQEENEEEETLTGTFEGGEMISAENVDDTPAEELLATYVASEFGIGDASETIANRKKNRGERLTGVSKEVYDYVSSQLPDIIEGNRSSAVFTFTPTKTKWTATELGVKNILVTDPETNKKSFSSAALTALFSNTEIIYSLIGDHPYELYWFNKVVGYTSPKFTYTAKYDTTLGEDIIWIEFDKSLSISMTVLSEYAKSKYEIDTSLTSRVRTAVANADNVLAKYSSSSDYNKLKGYCTEICDLVSYDSTAMKDQDKYGCISYDGSASVYGNPWQLVWVFDGDTSTNVVCEGYAKAFQYLCDKTSFIKDDICCICVSGNVSGGESHMWNVVTMDDGCNYIVDVTNCDDGTIGEGYKLFLAGAKGTVKNGFLLRLSLYDTANYVYSSAMSSVYTSSELTLADHYYGGISIANGSYELVDGYCYYDGTVKKPAMKVTVDGKVLTEGKDYTVEYAGPTSADKTQNIGPGNDAGAVLLTGIGDYSNAVLVTFDIKKQQSFSVNPSELTLEVGDWVSYTTDAPGSETGHEIVQLIGIEGELYIKSENTKVAKVSQVSGKEGWVRTVGPGTATITLTSDATDTYFEAATPLKLNVKECNLASDLCAATVKTGLAYTGSEQKPAVTVKYNGISLKEGTDYTLEYSNNINVGKGTVVIKGVSGRANGSRELTFDIVKADQNLTVKKGKTTIAKGGTVAVAPGQTVTLTVSGAGEKLTAKSASKSIATATVSGSKITVKGVKFGTSKLTITAAGSGNYNAGSTTVTINVVPAASTKLTATNMVTGIKLNWAKVPGATGYVLYRSDGKKTVVVKTITSGSTLTYIDKNANTNGTRYTFAVKAKKGTAISPLVKRTYMYRLVRPTISQTKSSTAGKMTVVWSKNTKSDGYEIQYSLNSNFSGSTILKVAKGTCGGKTFSGFTKGKKYYVRVRSYKMDGTTKNVSLWSKKGTVTIKK